MLIELVNSTSIRPGDKLLRRNPTSNGLKVVTVLKINNTTNNHFTFECDDDLVFTRSDLKLLKVIQEASLSWTRN